MDYNILSISSAGNLALFHVLGSGALPNLESLHLTGPAPAAQPPDGFTIPTNCLPRLRVLGIAAPNLPAPLIAALLAAAGPALSVFAIEKDWRAADAVVALLAARDYSWCPGLATLSLEWATSGEGGVPRLVATLACLPALRALTLRCLAYDDVVAHLMTMVELCRLARLAALRLLQPGSNAAVLAGGISDDIRLLLGLWLKRQAGGGRWVRCDISALRLSAGGFRTWVGTKTDQCIAQVEQALA